MKIAIDSPGLYYASLEGLVGPVQMLLDKGADVNAQGGYYGNALQVASSRGYEKVVQILLDKEADVNARGSFYNFQAGRDEEDVTPLYTTSFEGYEKVVQMLLEKNADVNAQGGDQRGGSG
ncbi:putative ankyrin repeat protein [Neofusicoccum parvum UCRNP2]|uniref:Putative ankyrin repeat protein n=1 Tax=Botryosphaeria parva (strain UCR-NP2) TaxID=1287680 RepID=R1FXZ8_BOTPV|nr:putative ankyrin repeat protein [Neofusicoccum parvum UCRNP2]